MNKPIIDENLFEQKYHMYAQMIKNISITYLKSNFDSEDAVQEVFLKYLNNYHKFINKNEEYEKYWLVRVTINYCKNKIKSKKEAYLDYEAIDSKEIKQTSSINDIYEKICNLSEKYKSVIILYYYEDMSVKQISKTLKISESAVKMRLKRGREELQKEVKND